MKYVLKLGSVSLDEELQVEYNTVTATNRVKSALVGLEDDGFHCNVFVWRVEIFDELQHIVYTKQFACIVKVIFAIGWEIWGKRTIGRTSFALVSTSGANGFQLTVLTICCIPHFFFLFLLLILFFFCGRKIYGTNFSRFWLSREKMGEMNRKVRRK